MIKIEAGAEPTRVNDKETGKEIFVSTTARITFRKAFPKAQKIRNQLLNVAIATLFSTTKTIQTFKPKSSHGSFSKGQSGVIREVGGGKFIAVIETDDIRILTFKGSPPQLNLPDAAVPTKTGPAPVNLGPAPVNLGPAPISDAEKVNPIVNMFPKI